MLKLNIIFILVAGDTPRRLRKKSGVGVRQGNVREMHLKNSGKTLENSGMSAKLWKTLKTLETHWKNTENSGNCICKTRKTSGNV